MSHIIVKFRTKKIDEHDYAKIYKYGGVSKYETINESDAKSWHLVSITGDGESTMCGQVYADYDTIEKEKNKGGITCQDCLNQINYAKNIKL